ncbi:MAG TPA: hypothetical protein V6D17_20300 [Candidatus Obscuribacterales bacterium]
MPGNRANLEQPNSCVTLSLPTLGLAFLLFVFLAHSSHAQPPLPGDPAIKVDDKITPAEKQRYEQTVQKSDKMVGQQTKVINKVPGVNAQPDDLREKKSKGPGLNPIAWLFRPITRLQEQTVRLEQQIMKLTGPIAALQPGMLRLENSMTGTNQQMTKVREQMVSVTDKMDDVNAKIGEVQVNIGGVENKMSAVQGSMGGVRSQMAAMQKDISAMRAELSSMKKPLTDLKKPIVDLRDPLMEIREPITTVGSRVSALDAQVRDLKALISLVLTSIFIAALLIAVGTPVAAILIWRNKNKLLPKAKAEEARVEHDMERAGRLMDRQMRR